MPHGMTASAQPRRPLTTHRCLLHLRRAALRHRGRRKLAWPDTYSYHGNDYAPDNLYVVELPTAEPALESRTAWS